MAPSTKVVTGKVAQFGRGVMADVSEKLLRQFVDNLETKVLSQQQPIAAAAAAAAVSGAGSEDALGAPAAAASAKESTSETVAKASDAVGENGPVSSGVRKITASEPVEPVDLLEASGASVAKAALPVLGLIFVLWVLCRLRRGKS